MPKDLDYAWQHCRKVLDTNQGIICNYYNKHIKGGGISHFKFHIAGGDRNVVMCTKQVKAVENLIREIMNNHIDMCLGKRGEKLITIRPCMGWMWIPITWTQKNK